MRYIFSAIFLTLLLQSSPAQLTIRIPENIHFITNDPELQFTQARRDTMFKHVLSGDIDYRIVGLHFDEDKVFTKIRLPQTLDRYAVIEQILIYYGLLRTEDDRKEETLLIYPFFIPVDKTHPAVQCKYNGRGEFVIDFNSWETVPVPDEPAFIEKKIYNDILEQTFTRSQKIDSIKDEVFESVANTYDLDPGQVETIYQKVLLWLKSR